MHKIFFIFFLLLTTAILSQVDKKKMILSEVDSFPVFEQIFFNKIKGHNESLLQAKLQQYIITNLNPKVLSLLKNETNYFLKIDISDSGKINFINTTITNKTVHEELKKVVESIEIKTPAKLSGNEVTVEIVLALEVKFQDIKIIK
ncbi:MAG: hypothetical protein COZ16_07065 [Flavobacteriaceae bacterium CG_4_10_14_3_um_filter_31_253]|nr:MAG: hypothetical protein AUK46_11435 [Flavobacteriaceae bacterium CG2_30_31_66]PIV97158.1 MAG: hypothetical protein COW43_04710 [Flavobacteriaceae bacterium CG17_big_fil_post_rev_8_21_14_2_50_31_13]PIX13619.1 MAG: hypothetical protein COZ74_05265 [Flavobacteriaceae bacterium CG_4_8_14_3_um_filter_31_8]PIY14877.1 MAG: hypothetical protein COZ16_07065 [Flavobacteriaceae bacterium CG_4_10_14_3_um_filter_31_253]PIZ09604.1 MAG: hypothetical protein COY55_12130 [Flavobacteriaceae bacterium CG_4_1